jgi:hypothetical protein
MYEVKRLKQEKGSVGSAGRDAPQFPDACEVMVVVFREEQ